MSNCRSRKDVSSEGILSMLQKSSSYFRASPRESLLYEQYCVQGSWSHSTERFHNIPRQLPNLSSEDARYPIISTIRVLPAPGQTSDRLHTGIDLSISCVFMLFLILLTWLLPQTVLALKSGSHHNTDSRQSELPYRRIKTRSNHLEAPSRCTHHCRPSDRHTTKQDHRCSKRNLECPAHHHLRTRTAATRHHTWSSTHPSREKVLSDKLDVHLLQSSSILSASQESTTIGYNSILSPSQEPFTVMYNSIATSLGSLEALSSPISTIIAAMAVSSTTSIDASFYWSSVDATSILPQQDLLSARAPLTVSDLPVVDRLHADGDLIQGNIIYGDLIIIHDFHPVININVMSEAMTSDTPSEATSGSTPPSERETSTTLVSNSLSSNFAETSGIVVETTLNEPARVDSSSLLATSSSQLIVITSSATPSTTKPSTTSNAVALSSGSLTSIYICTSQPTASPVGPCVDALPQDCEAIRGQSGPQISDNVQICQHSAKDLPNVNSFMALDCAARHSERADDLLRCLELTLPVCDSCIEAIPYSCTSSLYEDPYAFNLTAIGVCQSALGYAAHGFAGECWSQANGLGTLTGTEIEACLRVQLRICSDNSTNEDCVPDTTSSSAIFQTSFATSSTMPTPRPPIICLVELPVTCRSLKADIPAKEQIGAVKICETSLRSLKARVQSESCFRANVFNTLSGSQLQDCLDRNLICS